MPTDTWSYPQQPTPGQPSASWPGQQYASPPLPRLGRPRGWALLPLGLLLVYTFVPTIIDAALDSGASSLGWAAFFVPIWAIGYAAAKTRVLSARITKGYVVFVAVILGVGALFALMPGGWAMTTMAALWLVLYVWTVEAWARQVVQRHAQ